MITTALVSSLYFGGHQDNARQFMKMTKLMAAMLDKSRLNRRLYDVSDLLFSLFYRVGSFAEDGSRRIRDIIDSFSVAVCDNIRISRSKILTGKACGYSMPPCAGTFTEYGCR